MLIYKSCFLALARKRVLRLNKDKMTKIAYAKYLANLMQIDLFSSDLKNPGPYFYGLFEEFMPEGEGVSKVFKPLTCAKALQDRIMPLYEANKNKAKIWLQAGYKPTFSPPPSDDKAKLTALGKAHIDNLKKFAEFMDDKKFLKGLEDVNRVEIQKAQEAIWEVDLEERLYKAIAKWTHKAEFIDEKAELLKEAYESIAGNILIANYLLYPAFKHKPKEDFLKSYFEIFLLGHFCELDKNSLNIYPLAV